MTAVVEYLWLISTKTYQLKLAVLNILSIRMENIVLFCCLVARFWFYKFSQIYLENELNVN